MEELPIDKPQSLGLVWILKTSTGHQNQEAEVGVEAGEGEGLATMNERQMVEESQDMLKRLQIDQRGVLIADMEIVGIDMTLDMMIKDQTEEKAGEMIGEIEIEVVEEIVEEMKGVTEVDLLQREGDIGRLCTPGEVDLYREL